MQQAFQTEDWPVAITEIISGAAVARAQHNFSDAHVYQIGDPPTHYLKVAAHDAQVPLVAEHERHQWLAAHVPVPEVVAYAATATHHYLLTRAIAGVMVYDESQPWSVATRLQMLADAALQFHKLPIRACPFEHRGAQAQLQQAQSNVESGKVNPARFTPDLRDREPGDILSAARTLLPTDDDWVVAHGDLYPINILFDPAQQKVVSYLDVGRCGIADYYADLALIANTIAWHLDAAYIPEFFARYGITQIDQRKLRFYQLIHVLL